MNKIISRALWKQAHKQLKRKNPAEFYRLTYLSLEYLDKEN